jgi:hypothetical protein
MNKLALFLAGLLLGLFFGRFYPLAHAPLQYPKPNYPEHGSYAPDSDQDSDPCGGVAKASQPWPGAHAPILPPQANLVPLAICRSARLN